MSVLSVLLAAQKMIVHIGPVSADRISSEMLLLISVRITAVYVIVSMYDHISAEISTRISGDIQSANRTIISINFSLAIKTDTSNDRLSVFGLYPSILNGLFLSIGLFGCLDNESKVDQAYRRSFGRLNIS
jgi:hypothetical protein